MRIGYGVTVLSAGIRNGGLDGIGFYTHELGKALLKQNHLHLKPISFGVPIPEEVLPTGQGGVRLGRFAPSAALSVLTPFGFSGIGKLKKRIKLFHATDHLVPRLHGIPVLATVMDTIPLSHPQWINYRFRVLGTGLWRHSVRWADHVVTISEYSKQEIIKYFGLKEERVSVVPLGVAERFFEHVDESVRVRVLEKYKLPKNFYLFVGTLQPRKNVERLLQAHASLPADYRDTFPLVIVGRPGWGCDALIEDLKKMEAKRQLYWLRYLPDVEVMALMQSAQALVFPSLCEGFGLPVVEAFASRLPVITSNTTSLPEVAGDAALLVDPLDVEAIADGMRKVVEDSCLAQSMRERGLARARQLSWSSCASGTSLLYSQLTD